MLANDLFQDIPDHGLLPFNHLSGLFNGCRMSLLLKLVINKWLEELECHLFGKTALVQLQLGTDDDYRTSRIINALSKQVLTEAALLSFQCSRKRLQWTIVHTSQHAATTAVVEQGVNRLLQHALLVTHDH